MMKKSPALTVTMTTIKSVTEFKINRILEK